MPSLSSYRDLIDLSPRTTETGPTSSAEAQLDALSHLYTEYAGEDPEAYIPTPHEFSHQPESRRNQLVRDLLTIRDPREGPLPVKVVEALEAGLEIKSRNSPDPLVPIEEIKSVGDELFPQLPSTELPAGLDKLAFWRGDITRLASDKLAIVNPANTRMLGCFQPSHLCADNVIHAASGPRLRQDCFTIMESTGRSDLDVAEALLTKGYALPAGYVLHVAGPKLERGAEPTVEEHQQLESAYESCLDLAAEASNIDTVAFPCISTGLFAYPSGPAAEAAISTSLRWLSSHPSTPFRIIFVLFSSSDANHYLAALSSLYPSLPPPKPLVKHFALPERVKEWVREADSVIIHAGAGLSADAVDEEYGIGLDYNSKELFKKLYPDLLETTEMRTLYHSIGYDYEDVTPRKMGLHPRARRTSPVLGTNSRLLPPAPTRHHPRHFQYRLSLPYTILTSNADQLFLQSSFSAERIHNPQGSYSHFQCLKPCSPTSFFPSAPYFHAAAPHLSPTNMRIPPSLASELIPSCPNCGGEVFLNVRGGDWFLETPQAGQRARYAAQITEQLDAARSKGRKVLLLELGAGFNTPSVVRWPGEELCRSSEGLMRMVRVNLAHPEVPGELKEKGWAEGVRMGALDFLQSVLEER
ncbi:hypothetical protein BCR35DRAFT_336095 [Leucosporidium creatinivorum]|uniref:Macro domain-containing protein n=1 Tax=Leucosporidium creatinivorum TaxID=106004 RepID=A0A1Y2CQR4_9BASI|nr:hypothetical protein BCR35DRAFT_336095 [Leucosporidium creatinivorum]